MRKYLFSIIFLTSFIFCFDSNGYFEVDLGYNVANGEYEKYNDDGFTIRATYSNNIRESDFFRWQVSFQYISFYSHTYDDEFQMTSGNSGPTIRVTNSEDGFIFQGGLKFIPDLGLFQKKGIFKPYATLGVGLGYFLEYTKYEDPDTYSFLQNDGSSPFRLDDIEDQEFNFMYSIEFGANFLIPKWNNGGFDFGIRYNMSPKMKPITSYECSGSCADGDIVEKFSNKINADYITVYFGGTWPLNMGEKKDKSIGLDI